MTKDRWDRRITIANTFNLVLGTILLAYGLLKGFLQFHQIWFSLIAGSLLVGSAFFVEWSRRRQGGRAWKGQS